MSQINEMFPSGGLYAVSTLRGPSGGGCGVRNTPRHYSRTLQGGLRGAQHASALRGALPIGTNYCTMEGFFNVDRTSLLQQVSRLPGMH